MATRRPLVLVNGVTSELPAGDVVLVPVSGVTPGSARQLLQTNAAGTASEWTSNVDVPGTLDVTGVTTLDGAVGVSGTATFGGVVGVSGAAAFGSTSNFTGVATFASGVGVSGTAQFGSSATVAGAATFQSSASISGSATVAGTATFGGAVIVNTSGALTLPEGTTAERPAVPASGDIRFNTTTSQFEGYNGSLWGSLGGGAVGSGTDKVFYENDINVTGSYTITTGKNAMTAGPITVLSGVTVTVPSGSSWTVV